MIIGKNLALALRLVRRDWRSGELSILVTALIIAVTGATAVSLLGHRLTRTMTNQAAEFLAADLVVSGHRPAPDEWRDKARELTLKTARTVEFPSVLVENEEILLTGVKAVSPGYPLRGVLRVSTADIAEATPVSNGPEPGTAWVEQRVLATLHIALGGTITVGEKKLTVTRLIIHEPDRRGDLYSLSPRVMINEADLRATAVIQPGSHAHYYALFAGKENSIRQFKRWLKPKLHAGQRLVDIHEDRPEVGNALTRAERYLGLSSIVIVLIAGVAIAMSTRRYTERHFDMTAMLKCLGARERDVLQIYLAQFVLVGSAASLAGCLLGDLAQAGIAWYLRDFLPRDLASPAWYAPLFGVAVGLLVLIGFALPPVLRLKRLSPLRVLRRDLAPLPSSAWTVYGLALLSLSALLWRYTGDGRLTATVLSVGMAALAVAGLIALSLIKISRALLPYLSLPWRFGLQNLTRQPRLGVSQILAFGLTLVAMLTATLVRTELVQEWRRQLPENAPNHFALNLFEADLGDFQAFLARENIVASAYYPIVRGRLTTINGVDVHRIATKESQGEEAINRDLSLTWSKDLPPDNRLTVGEWWPETPMPLQLSVEEKLAASLRIKPGDALTFAVGDQNLKAVVASLRSVRWDLMTPNFYMIFSPGSLDTFPTTYLTSFYLAPGQKSALTRLIKEFPAVTILEVDALLKQFQTILREVSLAIEFVLLFALAAGFTVLFAAVRATLDERIREDALMRAMGASRVLLRRSQWLEFAALGFLSGLLAAAIAELIAWTLYVRIFGLTSHFHWPMWLATPALGALTVGISGYLNTRAVVNESPISVLRDT
jgi:putative ABC transport system permease protein